MAESKRHTAGKSSPRSQERGEQAGFPQRQPRSGSRRHHDRLLTPAERRKREEKRAAETKQALDAQNRDRADRKPKGWAGRRRER